MDSKWFDVCLWQIATRRAHAQMLIRLARMTSLRPERVMAHRFMQDARQTLRDARVWIIAAKAERGRIAYENGLSELARYAPARALRRVG